MLRNWPDLVPDLASTAPVRPLRAATPRAFHALACAAGPTAPQASTPPKLHDVDANVLVYLFDADSPAKQARAQELLREEWDRLVVSVQVLGEFYVTVTRKLSRPPPADAAAQAVDAFCRHRVEALHPEMMRAAACRSRSTRQSYWDALIVESALGAGAGILSTEDLQHGQEIDGLRIVNPFHDRARRFVSP